MKNIRSLFFFLLAILSLDNTNAQQNFSFLNLNNKNGLSQNSVFAICQDKEGFLWFGTRDGLNKFNGYEFKTYKNNSTTESLVGNDVRTLVFDSLLNSLWIGSISGLSKYNSETDQFKNYIHSEIDSTSITEGTVWAILRDSKKRLWIGTDQGLNLHDSVNDRFTHIKLVQSSEQPGVRSIIEDRTGNLFIGTNAGIFKLEKSSTNLSIIQIDFGENGQQLPDIFIKSLVVDTNNNMWIGTDKGGLVFWNRQLNKTTLYQKNNEDSNSLSDNNIRSLCFDAQNRLWVGTFDGLNLFKEEEKKFQRFKKSDPIKSGLSDSSIRSIFVDRNGNLWIGTYYGGILHLDENYNRFTNYSHSQYENSISSDIVSSFEEDNMGNLWIGTEGGGLNFLDIKTSKFKVYKPEEGKNSLSGNNVKKVLLDGDKLWIGTFNRGLNLLDIPSDKFTKFENEPSNPNSLSSNNVYGLFKKNKLLWILTYGGGLDIYDIQNKKFYHYISNPNDPKAISSDLTRVFLETTDGTLWIGTEKGLNKVITDKNDFPINFDTYLNNQAIYALQEDYEHNIWAGTISQGLFKINLKTNEVIQFTTNDGLPGNTIFGILEDDKKQLWISTNSGLSKFSPKEKTFTNYNYSNGLINSEYNFNAYYKTRSGDLLFGGINGFTRFNTDNISKNNLVPPIVFTELRQNNKIIDVNDGTAYLQKSINNTSKLIFKYNEANFSIRFAALDYINPNNVQYSLKMEGLDREWNNIVGQTEASYTIQREGNYVFRLKGSNGDGIWNPMERSIEIIVLPPPWRTWWAYLIYLLSALSGSFALIRYIKLRASYKFEKLEKQKQDEIHQMKLKFFTNVAHEFRTPLTLIQGPIEELKNEASYRGNYHLEKRLNLINTNSQRMLNLVNQLMTFRRMETGHEPMHIQEVDLNQFLGAIHELFKDHAQGKSIDFDFTKSTPAIKVWFDVEKMEKVIFNLLSNALKFTPNEGKIWLQIEESIDSVSIIVKDSGNGISKDLHEQIFQRFYEKNINTQNSIKGTGIGLSLSKQLVELHSGKLSVESEVGLGSSFIIQLKKGKNHLQNNEIDSNEDIELKYIVQHLNKEKPNLSLNPNIQLQEPNKLNKKILIVDDNKEILEYIYSIFQYNYKVIKALDGLEGWNKAKTHTPDIIISDVMMPKINGIELCQKIKSNIETSHIPVLLLTAKSMEEDKLIGLNSGANDYITKPFHPEELTLKIKNILDQQAKMKIAILQGNEFVPSTPDVSSADQDFLNSLINLVEQNISNPEINIEQFAQDLAVSRALLFTKIKAFTEMTPKNFLKSYRLKRAIQLLESGKLTVSEVAYQVGFKEPKYFSKVFQKEYGKTPSEFINSYKY